MKQYLPLHVVQDLLSTLHLQKVITNCYLTLTLGFLLATQDFYISKHMFLWSTRLKSFLKVVTINNVWLLVLNNICLNSFYLKIQLSSKNKTQYSVHKPTEWNWTKNCFFLWKASNIKSRIWVQTFVVANGKFLFSDVQ